MQSTISKISPDELQVVGGLGQGGFGLVVEVLSSTLDRFAMKCLCKNGLVTAKDRRCVRMELDVLCQVVRMSPFLLGAQLAFETATHVFIVMDILTGGDLFFRLDEAIEQGLDSFPEKKAQTLLAEISLGVVHLHSFGFLHLDLKIENIMLDGDGHVKIIDFGLAQSVPKSSPPLFERPVPLVGSLLYMPPELLRSGIGGRFTDWWAVGVIAHELLTGRSPWSSLTDQNRIRNEIKTLQLRKQMSISPAANDFLAQLLRKDHKTRLGSSCLREVLSSPFFSGIDWEAMEKGETAPALTPTPNEEVVLREDADVILDEYFELVVSSALEEEFSVGLLRVDAAPRLVEGL
jgi:serine/threonine protein kinase